MGTAVHCVPVGESTMAPMWMLMVFTAAKPVPLRSNRMLSVSSAVAKAGLMLTCAAA